MLVQKVPAISLFKTPEFVNSVLIRLLCDAVGDVWFAKGQPVHDQFGAYYGAIGDRVDANPYIQDLHFLRQLEFIRLYEYRADRPYAHWAKNMLHTRARASYASEVTAYLRIDGLREKTFSHEIWADRLSELRLHPGLLKDLNNEEIGQRWMRDLSAPGHSDVCGQQLCDFARLDREWCRIWTSKCGYGPDGDKPSFRVVEAHMSSPDRDATHQEWLESVSVFTDLHHGESYRVPFKNEARAYDAVRSQIEQRSGNAIFLK